MDSRLKSSNSRDISKGAIIDINANIVPGWNYDIKPRLSLNFLRHCHSTTSASRPTSLSGPPLSGSRYSPLHRSTVQYQYSPVLSGPIPVHLCTQLSSFGISAVSSVAVAVAPSVRPSIQPPVVTDTRCKPFVQLVITIRGRAPPPCHHHNVALRNTL